MTVGTRMIGGGYLRAIRAHSSPARGARRSRWTSRLRYGDRQPTLRRGPCTGPEPGRPSLLRSSGRNRSRSRRHREYRRGRPRRKPRCHTSTPAALPGRGPIPSTSRDGDPRAWPRTAPHRARDRTEPGGVRRAAAAGRARRRARSAEARRGHARPVRRRRRDARRDRPLQPVHADRVGTGPRDGRPARDRRGAGAGDPARHGRRRAVARGRNRARHRADGRRRSTAAGVLFGVSPFDALALAARR